MADMLNQTTISCNSCVTWLLTSIFAYVFSFTFSLFKSCNILQIKITWAIQQILICSEIWLVQKEKFRFKGNNQQLCSNSIFTGKRLWWRSFKCSCWYEGLQLYEKVTLSQMLSSGFCEVLQNIICEENCWSTASDF